MKWMRLVCWFGQQENWDNTWFTKTPTDQPNDRWFTSDNLRRISIIFLFPLIILAKVLFNRPIIRCGTVQAIRGSTAEFLSRNRTKDWQRHRQAIIHRQKMTTRACQRSFCDKTQQIKMNLSRDIHLVIKSIRNVHETTKRLKIRSSTILSPSKFKTEQVARRYSWIEAQKHFVAAFRMRRFNAQTQSKSVENYRFVSFRLKIKLIK